METMTEGHVSTHLQSDYGSWVTCHKCIFYPKFDFEMIELVIYEKYFKAKFVNNMLDFQFYNLLSAHIGKPNFG